MRLAALSLLVVVLATLGLATAQDTGTTLSASINNPSASATPASGATTASSSAPVPTSTSLSPVNVGDAQVPYLVHNPLTNQGRHSGRPRSGPYFSGCSDSSLKYAQPGNRINVSSVYSQFDRDTRDSNLGPRLPYSSGTLRIIGVGSIGNESYAFNNYVDSNNQSHGLLSELLH